MPNTDYNSLIIAAASAFSPASPIDKYEFFSGRIDQITRVVDTIMNKGQHAITYGERGVGKTSLANILHEVLVTIGKGDILVNKVNCDSSDNFTTVWRKALRQITTISEQPTLGFEPETKQIVMDLSQGLGSEIVPEDIVNAFRRTKKSIVFIFDEFDRISNGNTDQFFADTMKALSDYGIDGTLVLVGVGNVVDDLIKSHQSIERSLTQVKVQRMTIEELNGILNKGFDILNMTIEDAARDRIVRLSQGLPHFTHLLGREAARSALKSETLRIEIKHVNSAITAAVQGAEQIAATTYQKATSSSHPGHLYREVLLACALAPCDELGFFTPSDVRTPLSRIKGKPYDIPQYAQHLANFCTPERASVLTKAGVKHRYQYRFSNPMLRAHVVMRGFLDKMLTEDMLDLIPVWSP